MVRRSRPRSGCWARWRSSSRSPGSRPSAASWRPSTAGRRASPRSSRRPRSCAKEAQSRLAELQRRQRDAMGEAERDHRPCPLRSRTPSRRGGRRRGGTAGAGGRSRRWTASPQAESPGRGRRARHGGGPSRVAAARAQSIIETVRPRSGPQALGPTVCHQGTAGPPALTGRPPAGRVEGATAPPGRRLAAAHQGPRLRAPCAGMTP